jgi:uncharacterized membrane protein YuzA (DUF378 family)
MDLNQVALVLVIVGALNWGLVGAVEFDAVDKLTSLVVKDNKMINRLVYVLVGIAALVVAYNKLNKNKK